MSVGLLKVVRAREHQTPTCTPIILDGLAVKCVMRARPVHNHLLPTPRLTVSYLTIQYQTTFLWMGFCEI